MHDRDDPRALHALEQELRRHAPEPEFEFLMALQAELRAPEPEPRREPPVRLRFAFAGGLTVVLLAGLLATGGLSYAARSVSAAAKIVQRATRPQTAIVVRGLSAGSDQYRPGFGFGDPNHNHTGPPGLSRADAAGNGTGPSAPPLEAKATRDKLAATVSTRITFDEQAHLWISVIDARGKPLLLTQDSKRGGSRVGNPLRGRQAKFLQYAVLVPRTIPITLRIPLNLLGSGQTYRLRIVAIDPDGNRSTILVPFRL